MEDKEDLYFIALVPPEPHKAEVTSLKKAFEEKHNSKAALKSPPHITLQMPFKMPSYKVSAVELTLINFCSKHKPIQININGFGCFKPRVIFLDVEHNQQLWELQKELSKTLSRAHKIFHSTHKDNGFHPHMTLAFRDLKPAQFKLAWEEYKEKQFSFNFEATYLSLLKHNGKNWDEYRQFFFAGL
jgi:2'-5' RNA ligase